MNAVPPSKRGIAMVFQSYALYPHMTVFQNMAYALRLKGESAQNIERKVHQAAEKLELMPYLDRTPKALSGGQRQRVAIGRAIVRDPQVFLFDEPLSNLDAALRVNMRMEIAQLGKLMPNATMIYVTHDQVEAMTLADRIVVMKDGVIEQVGTPDELYNSPRTLFVATFIGAPKMNTLSGQHADKYRAHVIGVRPEHLRIDASGPYTGKVIHTENLGADSYIYTALDSGETIVVRESGGIRYQPDSPIAIGLVGDRVYRFDAEGQRLAA